MVKKRVFSERQREAIERIAKKVPETKVAEQYATIQTYITATGGGVNTGDAGWIFQNNFVEGLKGLGNTSGTTESQFIGEQVQLVGLRWEINAYTYQVSGSPNPGALYDYWFRFTVYEIPDFLAGNSLPSSLIEETNLSPELTAFKWNTDYAKIKFQRRWKMDSNGNLNALSRRKFYVPLGRKVEKAADLDGAVFPAVGLNPANQMGVIKGMQMYWVLEIWSPGNSIALITDLDGDISHSLYFKDA